MQDNSIFELKEAVTSQMILESGKRINASELVVPEALRDAEKSKVLARQFLDGLSDADRMNFQFAAVIQGGSYGELLAHYLWILEQPEINTICIPFNFEFDAWGNRNSKWKQMGWNRFSVIYRMVLEGVWAENREHHLLGLYNPAELAQYSKFALTAAILPSIRSNDSSSIFWHSLHGVSYDLGYGLPFRKIETEVDFNANYHLLSQSRQFDLNSDILQTYTQGHEGYALSEAFIRNFASITYAEAPILSEDLEGYLKL